MTFLTRCFVLAPLVLAACATVGPTASELGQAIAESRPSGHATPQIRRLQCETFEEEPTEFLCRWRQADASGAWRNWTAYLAVDSTGYHLIDDVVPADDKD